MATFKFIFAARHIVSAQTQIIVAGSKYSSSWLALKMCILQKSIVVDEGYSSRVAIGTGVEREKTKDQYLKKSMVSIK